MIAQIEQGIAAYLAANVEALESETAGFIARASTSSEEYLSSQGYVIVKVTDTQFVPGSLDVCTAMIEIMTVTPVNVEGYHAERQAEVEQALVSAFPKSAKDTISTAVVEACGFEWTGHYTEGFREGKEAQFFRPFMPLRASLVRVIEEEED